MNNVTRDAEYRILLIEDDELDRIAFERLVKQQKLPYNYDTATCFKQAKTILDSDTFDVVIVDYLLGDGTAFDVLDLLRHPAAREDSRSAETDAAGPAVILTTGAGNEETAVRAMKAGAYDYMIKDLERNYLKVLPQVVEKALAHKKTEDALKQYHNNLESLVKERTEQLAEEKELLSVTLSSMTDGVIAVNIEKRIILFNKVAENLTKWRYQEVRGKSVDGVFRFIDEKTRKSVESPIDKVLKSGNMESGTDRDALVARDGSKCPISATAAPICKNDGTTIGVVMVLRDVSREREVDRMKTDFVSSVSHELRTPLTSIKAYTATILRDPNMPEKTRHEFLSVIDEESNRLKSLIDGLLEVSRIEAGTVKVTREPVDSVAIVNEVVQALRPLAGKKNIHLKTDFGDQLGKLQADESKIHSMITNLLNNAIKFTPEQGEVCVSVRQRGVELVIAVSDTGIGIRKDDLPKIFDRFYRVYQPDKERPGAGLGLAIVKEIVNMHAGRIEVESEPGQGTTFTIFLLLDSQAALYS